MPRYLNGAERHYLAHLVNRDMSQFHGSDLMWRRLLAQKLVDPKPSAADLALELARSIDTDSLLSCNCSGPCQGCTASQLVAVREAARREAHAEAEHTRLAPPALAIAEATAPGRAARAVDPAFTPDGPVVYAPCPTCTTTGLARRVPSLDLPARTVTRCERCGSHWDDPESDRRPRLYENVTQDTLESRVAFAEKMRAYHEKIRAAGGTIAPGIAPDETVVTMPKGVDLPPFDLL